jgi:hypothetical protein
VGRGERRPERAIAGHLRDRRPIDREFLETVEELHRSLLGRLLHYQDVLEQHGLALPYVGRRTEADYIVLVPDEGE